MQKQQQQWVVLSEVGERKPTLLEKVSIFTLAVGGQRLDSSGYHNLVVSSLHTLHTVFMAAQSCLVSTT